MQWRKVAKPRRLHPIEGAPQKEPELHTIRPLASEQTSGAEIAFVAVGCYPGGIDEADTVGKDAVTATQASVEVETWF